jgi:excisionase family DNA binding protein
MDVIDYISNRETMLTTAEVAELLNLTPETIMPWVNKGYLSACQFRNFTLFNPETLARELRAAQQFPPSATIVAGTQPDHIPVSQVDPSARS